MVMYILISTGWALKCLETPSEQLKELYQQLYSDYNDYSDYSDSEKYEPKDVRKELETPIIYRL